MKQRRRHRLGTTTPRRFLGKLPALCASALILTALSLFLIHLLLTQSGLLLHAVSWVFPVSEKSSLLTALLPKDALSAIRLLREPEEAPPSSSEEAPLFSSEESPLFSSEEAPLFSSGENFEEGFEEWNRLLPLEEKPEGQSPSPNPRPTSWPPGARPILDLTVLATPESGYTHFDKVYLNNSTDFQLDPEGLLKKKLPPISKKGPQVLIVHSHATEAFTPEGIAYFTDASTYRSTDPAQNMVAVGDVLAAELRGRGMEVLHDTTLNDHPRYSGSYTRMLAIIEGYLSQYPSISCVLDVHRDSMISSDNQKQYKVITEINGVSAAQMMIVAGSAQGGLAHPRWQENLSFAMKLQQSIAADYPTLTRPIHLRPERFNEHATTRSLILEMGTSGNTLAEAKETARLIAENLYEVLTAP